MYPPQKPETLTTAGMIPHLRMKARFGEEWVNFWAPVKVLRQRDGEHLSSPDVRGDFLAFALPGGGEILESSWR